MQQHSKITPPSINKPSNFGLAVILIFFVGFGGWSLFATIESAAVADGFVTVESNRKVIEHLEGGIVKKIFVSDGEQVKVGQILLQIDQTQSQASLDIIKAQVNELSAEAARLIAERDNKKNISWGKNLEQQRDDPDVQSLMKSQQHIFTSHKKTIEGQLSILNQRKQQLQKEIESLEAQVKSETIQLGLINEELKAVEYLDKRNLIEKPRLLALKREAARLSGNRGEHLGLIARAKQRIGETEQQIITLLDTDQRDRLKRLREVQGQLANLQERLIAARDVFKRGNVVAPQAGTVYGLTQHTVGGVVKAGETLLEIVPKKDVLIIEARVSPLDIDVVTEGLDARVRLTALKQRNTPVLKGKVTYVSADKLDDNKTGAAYFKVYVTIDKTELAQIKKFKLYPGMPVNVMIVVESRSPWDYFVTPIKESFWRAFREQ